MREIFHGILPAVVIFINGAEADSSINCIALHGKVTETDM
jgi:hypothetical protein